jgi:uncharacterized SAM-binding protein YcdF (DUF218 family)
MVQILGSLVLPSQLGFLLAAAGILLLVPRRTRRAGILMLISAIAVLAVFSSGKTATGVMSPLEYAFPRIPDDPPPAQAIVVLAAYAADDPDMSLSDRPNPSALYRIVEGVLLWRKCQDCRVIVTGSSPTTEVMGALVVALGVPSDRVTLDTDAINTAASATNVQRLLGTSRFFLVTSAGHLPRAMAAFAARGLEPIPAPTDHQLPRRVAQASWTLSPFHLQASDLAMHEWVGALWYRLRGQ